MTTTRTIAEVFSAQVRDGEWIFCCQDCGREFPLGKDRVTLATNLAIQNHAGTHGVRVTRMRIETLALYTIARAKGIVARVLDFARASWTA